MCAACGWQSYLLAPATQARIRSVRYPGDPQVHSVPAGRDNRTAMLPKVYARNLLRLRVH